jgi:hypothetical protein
MQLSHFLSHFKLHPHFLRRVILFLNVFTVFATLDVRRGSMTMTYRMAWNI